MRILSAACLPLLLATTGPAQKATDTIMKKDGSRVRGVEVTSMTLEKLQWKRGNEKGEVPAYHVQNVEWGEPPDTFLSARSALDRGDFEAASQLFGAALNQAERPVLKTEIRFWQCRAAVAAAAANPSSAQTAAGAVKALMTDVPDSFRLPELMLLAGRALRYGKLGADADQALKQLDERATREGWGPIWSARAKYEIGLSQLDHGKPGEARLSFQGAATAAESALSNSSDDDAELRALRQNAKVGEGESYIGEKQFARAVDFYRSLASQADFKAAAKAGEGAALFLQAEANNKPEELRQAQLVLAEASVVDTGVGEASAKATYYLGRCLMALGADREGETFKARAQNYYQIVARNYAGTRWAAAAKAELAK